MLKLVLDLSSGQAPTLSHGTYFKAGGQIPVSLTLIGTVGTVTLVELTLASKETTPVVKASAGTFTGSGNVWTGTVDATDGRLATWLSDKAEADILVEVALTINGARQIFPNAIITVQPANVPGLAVGGGAVYLTTAYIDDTDTLSTNDALHVPSTRATIAYVAAHGGGGGGGGSLPYVQRQYLNTGETLTVPDECALIVAGVFRDDGILTLDGDIYFV